jgi:hypothetical protein
MKVTKKVLIGILAVGVVATAAYAATLMIDDFSYPDGDLVGQGGWAAHSGAGNLPVQVTGGEVYIVMGGGSREDVNKGFAAQAADATTYACFKFRVLSPFGDPVVSSEYFGHFYPGSTLFRSRVSINPDPAGGDFALGLNTTSNSLSPITLWAGSLSYGTTYRVVHSYDAATGDSELWLNPVDETSASITSVNPDPGGTGDSAGISVSAYAWRQSSEAFTVVTDDLSVGQAFDEVCNGAVQVDNTTWGQVKGTYR